VEHVLNCVRVLTRLFPFVYEIRDHEQLEKDIFWTEVSGQTLGDRLTHCVVDLLFLVDFTLPTLAMAPKTKVNYLIWEAGIGTNGQMEVSPAMVENRQEVLRLLLAILSKSMYHPQGRQRCYGVMWCSASLVQGKQVGAWHRHGRRQAKDAFLAVQSFEHGHQPEEEQWMEHFFCHGR
jgi:hypothetical protein